MEPLERLRRRASEKRAEQPPVISALDAFGVPGRAAAAAAGVSETTYSFWKTGVAPIPEKHKSTLVNLARQAQRILQESGTAHFGANRLKLARGEGLLRAAEMEANRDG